MAKPIQPRPGSVRVSPEGPSLSIASLTVVTDHPALGDCAEKFGWKRGGTPCVGPQWSPVGGGPVSCSMGEPLRIQLALESPAPGGAAQLGTIRGRGPRGISFVPERNGDAATVALVTQRPLPARIHKLDLGVRWRAEGAAVEPPETSNVVYVTMGRPRDDLQDRWQEDGVTRLRMRRSVEWVQALRTVNPQEIVDRLMKRFPTYSLHPSPKVPKRFHHPTYYNREGGAWPMMDYVEESGECQAIVRLIRAIIRQLGVPGTARVIVTWADPYVNGGARPIRADLEENPRAGLDAVGEVDGRQVFAALVDAPVREGQTYPPSHTQLGGGRVSPGLNRYEACLQFEASGETRYYCGGAGEVESLDVVLGVFWGLIWFSPAENDGFRVERIIRRYRNEDVA